MTLDDSLSCAAFRHEETRLGLEAALCLAHDPPRSADYNFALRQTSTEPEPVENPFEGGYAFSTTSYSCFLVIPGIGIGYLPSGPAGSGAGESIVNLSTPGANSWSELRKSSKVT